MGSHLTAAIVGTSSSDTDSDLSTFAVILAESFFAEVRAVTSKAGLAATTSRPAGDTVLDCLTEVNEFADFKDRAG